MNKSNIILPIIIHVAQSILKIFPVLQLSKFQR